MAILQAYITIALPSSSPADSTRRRCSSLPGPKIGSYHKISGTSHGTPSFGFCLGNRNRPTQKRFSRKDWILIGRRVITVKVKANQGSGGFNGGDGGGGWDKKNTSRVLGNLALAIGLTYLTMTGQLGWVLDAIVSLWLLAVILPIVGLGAFFWFAGRDIVQSSCPNCGNDFQIFRSSLKDGPQLCPFCTQPFSVQGDKFVRETARFSSERSRKYGQPFNGFPRRSDKGKASTATVVDIEAEVKDID